MKELIIYKCPICGNMAIMIEDAGVNPICCGKPMQSLSPDKEEASLEKHIPVVVREGENVYVKVGAEPHPMTDNHFIKWIILLTDRGTYTRMLRSTDLPETHFSIAADENVVAVYDYCNLHGLWVNENTIRRELK